jgi:hypothetical protein
MSTIAQELREAARLGTYPGMLSNTAYYSMSAFLEMGESRRMYEDDYAMRVFYLIVAEEDEDD